jgi:hypothetical protein
MPEYTRHPGFETDDENALPPAPSEPPEPPAPRLDHRSTGPTSVAGKARSSKNALRHGLYSADPLLPGEDPELYELFVMGFYDSCDPAPGAETVLVHRLADAAWRIRRASGAEIAIYQPDTHPLPPHGTPLVWLGGPGDPQTVEAPALPPDATPGQVYLYRLRTGGDPFRGISRHAERLHRQFCRDLVSFHSLRRISLDREANRPPNPYLGRKDRDGYYISRHSDWPGHMELWDLEVRLGLHDHDGNLPDP